MKKVTLNRLNVIFVGIVLSLLCITITYLLLVDWCGLYDITGLKERYHVKYLAELHPLHTMFGLDISIIYILASLLVLFMIHLIKNLKRNILWTHKKYKKN